MKSVWVKVIKKYVRSLENSNECEKGEREIGINDDSSISASYIPGSIEVFVYGQQRNECPEKNCIGDVFIGNIVDYSDEDFLIVKRDLRSRKDNNSYNEWNIAISYILWKDIRNMKFHFPRI